VAVLAEPDGSVVLSNQAGQEINIGLWSVSSGTSTFPLPQDTIILGGQSIRIPPSVMHMDAGTDTILRYPNNVAVATAIPVQPASPVPMQISTKRKNSTVVSDVSKKTTTTSPAVSLPLVAATAEGSSGLPLWSWILGAGGIILIGIGAFSYAIRPPRKETIEDADEFEIEG
jgi:hypothetical protein